MRSYPVSFLAGNPAVESIEVSHPHTIGYRGLPDSPELEREMAAAFPNVEPTDEELEAEYRRVLADTVSSLAGSGYRYGTHHVPGGDGIAPRWEGFAIRPDGGREYAGWHFGSEADATEAAILLAGRLARADGGDDDRTPPAGAIFPEVTTWPDDDLLTAISLADHRHPALRDPDALLHECSAELVRRLESRGVRFAA